MLNTPHNWNSAVSGQEKKTVPEVEKELRNETGKNYEDTLGSQGIRHSLVLQGVS